MNHTWELLALCVVIVTTPIAWRVADLLAVITEWIKTDAESRWPDAYQEVKK